jgi:putative transposase
MPPGFPSHKRKFDKQSIRYPQRFKLIGNRIYLPKVGMVNIRRHRRLEGEMKNCTVSKTKTGKYFVSIQCECKEPALSVSKGHSVGIDLGLKDFAILSSETGTQKVEAPKPLRKSERLLKIRQRRLSRKDKQSRSRDQARHRVAATHEKITNRRKDFHHQLSRQIVEQFDCIGLETLNVAGMLQNHNLAKSIADAGWSQFVTFLAYKAAWAGVEVVRHDPWLPSSKTCHDCGHINRNLKLTDRTWVCPTCGVLHDRDENAAKNLQPNKQSTAGAAGTRPEICRRVNAGWEGSNADTSSAVRRVPSGCGPGKIARPTAAAVGF